ncbi:hypothetical protein [Micromonospora sp. NBC_01813]|uniref:hypothetical protein n=1 Tax=Micromonospora sp. NBC_01813 TaxID=2975988 RepID=UPI002DD9FB0A|nr:hypothetical protein [Micromonospora sp. NBC_01813]WSA07268.1 hypothetical protein OG958_23840 [Micromonospora sp. NBC_01813]
MEELSPDQSPDTVPGRRRTPRSRSPEAASTPPATDPADRPARPGKQAAEKQSPDKPSSGEQPGTRPTRTRRAPAAIAPVLFQPPAVGPDQPVAGPPAKKAGPPAQKAPAQQPGPPAQQTPAKKAVAKKAAAKRSPAKKAAPAVPSVPADSAAPVEVPRQTPAPTEAPSPTPAPAPVEVPRQTLRHLVTHAAYAPELLALAAVDRIGPTARDWAARLRDDYPAASDDALARLATRQFTRIAGAGAVASTVAGLLAPALELAAVGWAQAALTLHVSAAYRHDPTDRRRAAELLVLTGVHPDVEAAQVAVDAAADEARRPAGDDGDPLLRFAGGAQRVVMAVAGPTRDSGWGLLRLPARLLPGARALVAYGADTLLLERLAARATAHYRPVTAS